MQWKRVKRQISARIPLRQFTSKKSARVFIPAGKKALIVIPFQKLTFMFIILLVGASVYLFLRSDFFLIRHIDIEYTGGISGDEEYEDGIVGTVPVQTIIEPKVLARSLWGIQSGDLRKEIIGLSPAIKEVNIARKMPDRLVISVTEHEPQIVLFDSDENPRYFLLNNKGVIFIELPRSVPLPELYYPRMAEVPSEDVITQTVAPAVINDVLLIMRYFVEESKYDSQRVALIDDQTVEVLTTDTIFIRFSLEKEIKPQLRSVEVLYKEIQYTGNKPSLIDTRFDKIVVRY